MPTDAAFSFYVSTVGLILPFVLTDPPTDPGLPGEPMSNAESATVVWVAQDGKKRQLTRGDATAALFTYSVSMLDSRYAHLERGYLEVTLGANVFLTSAFLVNVVAHF